MATEKKQPFDKTAYCFKYQVEDVQKAVNNYLDELNFEDQTDRIIEQCASLLVSLQQCEAQGETEILLNAQESMMFNMYQKSKTKKKSSTNITKGKHNAS
jgi:hypothetical protein